MIRTLLALALLTMALAACNKDETIESSAPRILLDREVYTLRAGGELTVAPRYENVEGATYLWTVDGTPAGNGPELHFRAVDPGRFYARIEVRTSGGEAREELRIDVGELEIPYVTLPGAEQGFTMALGSTLRLQAVVAESSLPTRCRWTLGETLLGEERTLLFSPDRIGDFELKFEASNEDGSDSAACRVEVLDAERMPVSWNFDRTRFSLALGRTVRLAPQQLTGAEGARFTWTSQGELLASGERPELLYTGTAEGRHLLTLTLTLDRGTTTATLSQDLDVEVGPAPGTYRRLPDSGSRAEQTRVFEYLPAPGQFINEPFQAATMEEACLRAGEMLAAGELLSLGGFGGRAVVGFDHSIPSSGGYDFAIGGNSFDTSSEPGIVWVMQDENGNGEPDDTWYELRGSESSLESTWQDYAVTYYRPRSPRTAVAWSDNRGGSGEVPRQPYHMQDHYYPAWVEADSYTLRGTRLEARNYRMENGDWNNPPFAWGYADNFSPEDRLPADGGAESSVNRFRIADAMRFDGEDAGLEYIDFVMVQTALNTHSGHLGENSTEITGIRDLHIPQQP